MKTTIDGAGRLVIPKELREAAGLEPGADLEIRLHDGRIEIEPVGVPVRLRRRGRFLVAEPKEPAEALTKEAVAKVLDETRARRGGKGGA